MADTPQARIRQLTAALHSILHEAGSARSALCEHELVIRLDNILALARSALREGEEASQDRDGDRDGGQGGE